MESIASGLVSGINACLNFKSGKIKCKAEFPSETVIGALANYISTSNKNFQPMNANFGILPELDEKIRDKKLDTKKWHKDHSNITEALQICNIFVTNSKHLEKM